jgi:hypothetical protein
MYDLRGQERGIPRLPPSSLPEVLAERMTTNTDAADTGSAGPAPQVPEQPQIATSDMVLGTARRLMEGLILTQNCTFNFGSSEVPVDYPTKLWNEAVRLEEKRHQVDGKYYFQNILHLADLRFVRESQDRIAKICTFPLFRWLCPITKGCIKMVHHPGIVRKGFKEWIFRSVPFMFNLLPSSTDMNSSSQMQAAVKKAADALLRLDNPFLPFRTKEEVNKPLLRSLFFFAQGFIRDFWTARGSALSKLSFFTQSIMVGTAQPAPRTKARCPLPSATWCSLIFNPTSRSRPLS